MNKEDIEKMKRKFIIASIGILAFFLIIQVSIDSFESRYIAFMFSVVFAFILFLVFRHKLEEHEHTT